MNGAFRLNISHHGTTPWKNQKQCLKTPSQPFQRFIKVLELGYWQTAKSQGLQLTAVKGKRGQEGLFWILSRALVQVPMSGTQIFE
jgi:hypothetical protein